MQASLLGSFLSVGKVRASFHRRRRSCSSKMRRFLHVFWAVPLNTQNGEEGTPAFFLVFGAHSKAVPLNTQKCFFLVFWARSKAVSLNTKNGEATPALVKHENARAGERHQLVGHQMNKQVRHRARSLKVNRARLPERVLTPLSSILGTRSVGKPAMKLWRR